jgi:ferritin-like metal-binding protein YciE
LSYFVFNYEKEEDFSVVNDKIIQEREIKMIEKSLDNASNPQVKERLNSVLEKTKDRLKTLEKIEKIEDEQSSDVKIWSSISVLY